MGKCINCDNYIIDKEMLKDKCFDTVGYCYAKDEGRNGNNGCKDDFFYPNLYSKRLIKVRARLSENQIYFKV